MDLHTEEWRHNQAGSLYTARMCRPFVCALAIGTLFIGFRAAAQTVSIDFDDGTPGQAIDGFYSVLGVTFSQAKWADALEPPFDGIDDHIGASLPYVVIHFSSDTVLDEADPIVATFDQPATSVSIRALDVGAAGIQMNAYDDAVAGTLVASDSGSGGGSGTLNSVDLLVTASEIRRIEVFQPVTPIAEGTLLDNLEYTLAKTETVSALSLSASMVLAGLLVIAARILLVRWEESATNSRSTRSGS